MDGYVDVCTVDGMFMVQSHVDLPSTFGGEANVPLSHLVRRANHVEFACFNYHPGRIPHFSAILRYYLPRGYSVAHSTFVYQPVF